MKKRFNVTSGARDKCVLCNKRGDAVYVEAYAPVKYRAYICYTCLEDLAYKAKFPKEEPAKDVPTEEKKSGRKASKTS